MLEICYNKLVVLKQYFKLPLKPQKTHLSRAIAAPL